MRLPLVAMIAASLAAPLAVQAQAGKVHRVGYVHPSSIADMTSPTHFFNSSFRPEMRRRGYVEGQNLVLEPTPVSIDARQALAPRRR